jgi:cytochrome c-type biogenesis protein CcmH/NrfF
VKRFFLALALCSAMILPAAAESDRYNELGGKIMCTCGCGQMLLKCNHVGCQSSDKMIKELKSTVALYPNDEDVLNWFRTNYGVTTVVAPGTHGFELTIWVVPPLLSVLSVLLVIFLIRKWRMRAAQLPALDFAGNPHLDELRSRARQETEL